MKYRGIPICYYPTTVICVDDSKDFLLNFSLQFDPLLAYQLYSSPHAALNFLKKQQDNQLEHRCMSQNEHSVGNPATTQSINFDLSSLYREVYEPKRFAEASVVLVDFSMPDINGLEFCKRLQNRPLKKILLTGQADADTAIRAFNEGLIDFFILKSDPQAFEKVSASINDLQCRYFQEKSEFMVKAMLIDSPNFLQDDAFVKLFKKICAKHNIVEYYMTEITGTFLLLNANGEALWFILRSDSDLEMYHELGKDMGAPTDVLTKLRNREYIPHFWSKSRFCKLDPIEWDSYLYPASSLEAKEQYYYALAPNPSISELDTDGIAPFNKYLEHLDVSLS